MTIAKTFYAQDVVGRKRRKLPNLFCPAALQIKAMQERNQEESKPEFLQSTHLALRTGLLSSVTVDGRMPARSAD